MVERTYYYIQQETEPFRNLALERYLLENVPKHSRITSAASSNVSRDSVSVGSNIRAS